MVGKCWKVRETYGFCLVFFPNEKSQVYFFINIYRKHVFSCWTWMFYCKNSRMTGGHKTHQKLRFFFLKNSNSATPTKPLAFIEREAWWDKKTKWCIEADITNEGLVPGCWPYKWNLFLVVTVTVWGGSFPCIPRNPPRNPCVSLSQKTSNPPPGPVTSRSLGLPGEVMRFCMILLKLQESGKLTSCYGKYPTIHKVLYKHPIPRWFGNGISYFHQPFVKLKSRWLRLWFALWQTIWLNLFVDNETAPWCSGTVTGAWAQFLATHNPQASCRYFEMGNS